MGEGDVEVEVEVEGEVIGEGWGGRWRYIGREEIFYTWLILNRTLYKVCQKAYVIIVHMCVCSCVYNYICILVCMTVYTVYSVQCTVYNVQCTMYTLHCACVLCLY